MGIDQQRLARMVGWPWSSIATYFTLGIFMCVASWYGYKTNWRPPTEHELVIAQGNFVDQSHKDNMPYEFVTDSGLHLQLGCLPEYRVASCLEHQGIWPKILESGRVTLAYFEVHTPSWEYRTRSWPDVIAKITKGGRPMLSFETTHGWFEHEYDGQRVNGAIEAFIFLAPALLFLYLGARFSLAKLAGI
jgi:hypothetical protein